MIDVAIPGKLANGLGGVWLGVAPEQRRMDKVRGILDLPDNVEPFSVFVLGYPAEQRNRNRFRKSGIIHI